MFPIGVFDSGVGGLTVVRSLREQLPQETYCYFGDTARVPYGTKSAETIRRYSVEIARFLMSHDAKIIVVACNTASSTALDDIRSAFSGPVVGVVEPGIRAALQATRKGRIGIIGTKSTIRSGAYQQRLRQNDASLHIVAQPCPLFVPLVEEGWEQDPITRQIAERYLAPLVAEKVDVVIMGCTHYPLLQGVIRQVLGDEVALVSSAEEVSKEVKTKLREMNGLAPQKIYKDLFYASDDIAGFQRLCERFCGTVEAVFAEAGADFFAFVQQAHRFKESLASRPMQWFQPLEETPAR